MYVGCLQCDGLEGDDDDINVSHDRELEMTRRLLFSDTEQLLKTVHGESWMTAP